MSENAKEFEEIRMAAAGMEAAGQRTTFARVWLVNLQRRANPDGSYGKGAEIPRATGGTVAAILRLGGKAGGFRLGHRHTEQRTEQGRWFGKDDTGASDLESSYRIMRCYHMLKPSAASGGRPRIHRRVPQRRWRVRGSTRGSPSNVSGTYLLALFLSGSTKSDEGRGMRGDDGMKNLSPPRPEAGREASSPRTEVAGAPAAAHRRPASIRERLSPQFERGGNEYHG